MDRLYRYLCAPLPMMMGLALLGTSAVNASDRPVGGGLDKGEELSGSVSTQSGDRFAPVVRPSRKLFQGETMVTTGFSGARLMEGADGVDPRGADSRLKVIDPRGASVMLTSISDMGHGFNGNEVKRIPYDKILASDVGQVFGVAMDDAAAPNLYLTATSAYGIAIMGDDADGDGLEDKLYTGRSDARFMKGQFGGLSDSDPGAIYKVDGETGQVSLFASIEFDGVLNSGPGLGNIAFDAASQQLFVSDLDTGTVHRLDLAGNVLEVFDHGSTALSLAGRSPVAHDAEDRMDITSPGFDVEDPRSWGFAADARRVWGLAAHSGRLYYAVAEGGEIWSVGINKADGAFLYDAKLELSLPRHKQGPEISDIAFGPDGSIIVAQRGERLGSYDFTKPTRGRQSEVLRFVRDRTRSDGVLRWKPDPVPYAVGFAHSYSNADGGVALGPSYDETGFALKKSCKGTVWTSGNALRDRPELAESLLLGGAMKIDGVQAQPFGLPKDKNSPPWLSYFIDYDNKYPERPTTGLVGDVEILGCQGGDEGYYDFEWPDQPYDPGDSWWPCLINPQLCEPPKRDACLKTRTKLVCNKVSGKYELQVVATDDLVNDFDRMTIDDLAGTLPALPTETGFPTNVKISAGAMAAGQIGQVKLCAFNGADRDTGRPYDCCKAEVTFQIPDIPCKKGVE